ncbi:OmpA family protein [candidate division KSB1 bacterium]|nr:OmpA family protein [candidate division KSB1 bacterium]
MKSSRDNALEKLRSILLEEDTKKLEMFAAELQRLKEQLNDEESLIEILDPVLADLLDRKIHDSREDMAAALAPVMGDAIRNQISEAKEDMVDALYPVIGQTIRKSVAESMKNLVDTINKRIDQAISGPILALRLKSRLTGVKGGELVLKDVFPFQVNEVFLIHKDSGLLIAHASSSDGVSTMDKELVSGMLTAIRDFVNEAFHSESVQDLEEIQYGDSKILLEFGRCAYFAFVTTGVEPIDFQEDISKFARKMHNRYHKKIRSFDGDITNFSDITRSLQLFINQKNQEHALSLEKGSGSYIKYILAVLGGILLIVWLWSWLPDRIKNAQLEDKIEQNLQAISGNNIYELNCNVDDGWLAVSAEVATVQTRSRLDSVLSKLSDIRGYTLNTRLRNNESLSGMIQESITQKLKGIDFSGNSKPRFIIEGDVVTIEGEVSDIDMRRKIAALVSEVGGVRVVINNLHANGGSVTGEDDIRKFLDENVIFFRLNNDEFSGQDTLKLKAILSFLQQHESCKLLVKGYSDSLASSAYNFDLSKRRANRVCNYLISNGLSSDRFDVRYYGDQDPLASNSTEEGRSMNRRVEFEIVQER